MASDGVEGGKIQERALETVLSLTENEAPIEYNV